MSRPETCDLRSGCQLLLRFIPTFTEGPGRRERQRRRSGQSPCLPVRPAWSRCPSQHVCHARGVPRGGTPKVRLFPRQDSREGQHRGSSPAASPGSPCCEPVGKMGFRGRLEKGAQKITIFPLFHEGLKGPLWPRCMDGCPAGGGRPLLRSWAIFPHAQWVTSCVLQWLRHAESCSAFG